MQEFCLCELYHICCSVLVYFCFLIAFVLTQPEPVSPCPDPPPRPPSELSQFGGSSGYGSTRSQVVPQLTKTEHQKKFHSLRNGKRSRSDWPQFRSLRTPNKRKMLPIKENSPELQNPPTKDRQLEVANVKISPPKRKPIPPTPAPRKIKSVTNKQPMTPKHTYQNVPIPITPNNSSNTDTSVNSTNEEVS